MKPPAPARAQRDVYTVARLNREARQILESGLGMLWLEGEISNLARPASGHWYFSLKDSDAQIRCAMFRGRNRSVQVTPQNGAQVVVRGRVGLYEPRGDFQFIAEHMTEAGAGSLQQAFDALKARLDAQGLFAPEHKQALPTLPVRIGVITSPSGAVIRDILQVLQRRFPAVEVLVYPVPVQGDSAAPAIVAALELAAQRNDCDVLIIARGGGSLEDLWPFNEEIVAHAVFACPIPIISAVGHETDVTICDFVADVRAPTPSAAAELAVPDARALLGAVRNYAQRLGRAVQRRIQDARKEVTWLRGRHRNAHPGVRVRQLAQRLDEAERRLIAGGQRRLAVARAHLDKHAAALVLHNPRRKLDALRSRAARASTALDTRVQSRLQSARHRLTTASRALTAIGPQATLERGYAIVTDARDGRIVTQAQSLSSGAEIAIRLAHGSADATVTHTYKKGTP